ncbi:hypothetical protein [Vibrio harveyi]|uniref:hypothetical protein n=1 Tax=Vibrio harveyi TaxID=669 RepID=UPI0025AFB402|nr:hypothetical protein [Vibrio harveyi]WJT11049.1 hypothetical protein PH545_28315 [Vibrio harveyi]
MIKHLGEDLRKLGVNLISAVAIAFAIGDKELSLTVVVLGVAGYMIFAVGIYFSARDDRKKKEKEKENEQQKTILLSTLIPNQSGIMIYTSITKDKGEDL